VARPRFKHTHDYTRHGTTTLFAALEVATGRVTDLCYPRHRHEEFLAFLKLVARAYPRRELHVVVDNYAAHKHPRGQGLAGPPSQGPAALHPDLCVVAEPGRGLLCDHYPPGPARGDFSSVAELVAAIGRFVDGWNERCQPFRWAKDADQILAKLARQPLRP
jgi:hypothetical protein